MRARFGVASCLSVAPILADARAILDAVNASTLTGIPAQKTRGVQALIGSFRQILTPAKTPGRSDREFCGNVLGGQRACGVGVLVINPQRSIRRPNVDSVRNASHLASIGNQI